MHRSKFCAVLFLFAFVAGVLTPAGQALAFIKSYINPEATILSYKAKMPRAIHFATESGRNLTGDGLILERRANLFVDVTDTDKDGRIDAGDYKEISYRAKVHVAVSIDITPKDLEAVSADYPGLTESSLDNFAELELYLPKRAKEVKKKWDEEREKMQSDYQRGTYVWTSTIGGANTNAITVSMPDVGIDLSAYPRRLTPFTITATQQGGDDSSKFPEQYATLSYKLTHRRSGGGGISDDVVVTGIEPETPLLNVTVRPRDQGGKNGDNGGGSCDALGFGTALLALPALGLAIRRRRG